VKRRWQTDAMVLHREQTLIGACRRFASGHFQTCRPTCAVVLRGCGIILAVLLFLVTIGRNEHALQNRCLSDRRLVLRRFLHGRRLGDCRLARRADLLRDLNRSKQGRHSITSSARPSNDCGNVMPSVFAVLRLITNSVFEDCWTGRLAVFSPFRMRPV
jgi:hypothetical protein